MKNLITYGWEPKILTGLKPEWLTIAAKNIESETSLKVVTHDGAFHADEVLAITLLRLVSDVQIIRTRDVKYIRSERMDYVLDVGREYSPEKGFFDHHQDTSLPASNMLVAKHLFTQEFMEVILPFMDRVSNIDTGKQLDRVPTEFNNTIRSLNGVDDGFNKALSLAKITVEGIVKEAELFLEGPVIWNQMKREGEIKFNPEPQGVILQWKDLAKEEGISFLVMTDKKGEGIVLAANTAEKSITPHSGQLYLGNGGYFAKYKDFESAFEHAKTL